MKVHLRKRKLRYKGSSPATPCTWTSTTAKANAKGSSWASTLNSKMRHLFRNEKLKLAENIKAKRMMELA